MTDKTKKTIILNTLILFLCIVVVSIFCIVPNGNFKDKDKEKEVVDIYTINFDSDGGTSIAAIEVSEGKGITIPKEPTKEGYIFDGWLYNGEPYDFDNPVEGNITLTAKWKKIDESKKYYTVSFDVDGGSAVAAQVIEENTPARKPVNPTKDGFEFVNWTLDGVPYEFTEPVTKDITIKANYKEAVTDPGPEEPQPKRYTVRFNLNGGAGCNTSQTVTEGGRARYCAPTRYGYTFTGWTPDIGMTINSNQTFTAQWTELSKYNIVFNYNGSTVCPTQTPYVGEVFNLNNYGCRPNKPHHNFIGWSKNSGASSGEGTVTSSVATTINLFAIYAKKTYTHNIVETSGGDNVTNIYRKVVINGRDGEIAKIELFYDGIPAPMVSVDEFIPLSPTVQPTCKVYFTDEPSTPYVC